MKRRERDATELKGRVARQASQADSGSPTMPSLSTRASTQVPASSQPSANFSRNGRHAKAQAGGGSFTAERVGSDVRAASGSTIAGLLTNGWLRLVQLDSRKRHEKRKGRWDELKLWAMGYKQELNRGFTLLNNFAVAQALMSCFVIVESFSLQGLTYGGPVVMVWGWVLVSIATLNTAACLAELCSAFPTSGGMYYYSFLLGPPKYRRVLCWFTGWLNLLGQVAFTSATELVLVYFLLDLVSLHMSGAHEGPGYKATTEVVALCFAGMLALQALMCSITQKFSAINLSISAFLHFIAAPAFVITLLVVAPTKNSAAFVFTEWMPNREFHGLNSDFYIIMVGLLMSTWTICGYDSCIHLCEETIEGDVAAPWAMVLSVGGAGVLGLFFVISMLFCVQSVDNLFDPESVTGGAGIPQLTWDVFKARYGTGIGALPFLYIPLVALYYACFSSILSNGRMLYAFSRDDAMLGSRFWRRLMPCNKLPVNASWLMAALAFLMGLPGIYNQSAFNTISAASVVALTWSYAIPIGLRAWHGQHGFIPGPFKLGRWSRPMGVAACLWIAFVTASVCAPGFAPDRLTKLNFNYAPVMIVAVLAFAGLLWWAPFLGGNAFFSGPKPNLTSEAVQADPSASSSLAVGPSAPAAAKAARRLAVTALPPVLASMARDPDRSNRAGIKADRAAKVSFALGPDMTVPATGGEALFGVLVGDEGPDTAELLLPRDVDLFDAMDRSAVGANRDSRNRRTSLDTPATAGALYRRAAAFRAAPHRLDGFPTAQLLVLPSAGASAALLPGGASSHFEDLGDRVLGGGGGAQHGRTSPSFRNRPGGSSLSGAVARTNRDFPATADEATTGWTHRAIAALAAPQRPRATAAQERPAELVPTSGGNPTQTSTAAPPLALLTSWDLAQQDRAPLVARGAAAFQPQHLGTLDHSMLADAISILSGPRGDVVQSVQVAEAPASYTTVSLAANLPRTGTTSSTPSNVVAMGSQHHASAAHAARGSGDPSAPANRQADGAPVDGTVDDDAVAELEGFLASDPRLLCLSRPHVSRAGILRQHSLLGAGAFAARAAGPPSSGGRRGSLDKRRADTTTTPRLQQQQQQQQQQPAAASNLVPTSSAFASQSRQDHSSSFAPTSTPQQQPQPGGAVHAGVPAQPAQALEPSSVHSSREQGTVGSAGPASSLAPAPPQQSGLGFFSMFARSALPHGGAAAARQSGSGASVRGSRITGGSNSSAGSSLPGASPGIAQQQAPAGASGQLLSRWYRTSMDVLQRGGSHDPGPSSGGGTAGAWPPRDAPPSPPAQPAQGGQHHAGGAWARIWRTSLAGGAPRDSPASTSTPAAAGALASPSSNLVPPSVPSHRGRRLSALADGEAGGQARGGFSGLAADLSLVLAMADEMAGRSSDRPRHPRALR